MGKVLQANITVHVKPQRGDVLGLFEELKGNRNGYRAMREGEREWSEMKLES